ncbi:MAG: DNA-3-methyladenine glycosylase I [Bryobacteraceae bacterium]
MDDGLIAGCNGRPTCWWHAGAEDYERYHDQEWGWPVADDNRLFEKLCLEGFQAGLSWITILRKRENFRRAFHGFDIGRVALMDERDVGLLLGDAGIVRHRGKIEAAISNARNARALIDEHGSLAAYLWRFEPAARPERLDRPTLGAKGQTPESKALSKDLRKRGFNFVGPTTMYAFMQAMGLVNDHLEGCWVRPEIETARKKFRRPR